MGMNLLQSTSSRNPLFSRDRKLDPGISPNAFDPAEFPSLGNRDNSSGSNQSLSARPNYVGMVKQPAMESNEFQMSNEDFPALPGSNSGGLGQGAMSGSGSQLDGIMASSIAGLSAEGSKQLQGGSGQTMSSEEAQSKRGIITSPDGLVTNIPSSMVRDQFGMIGLLTFIRAAETDPNLVSLALGADLTTLGLNLNSEVNLYPTFAGPWAETPCRPQDIDYHVPQEYLVNAAIRDKLAPVKLNRYKDDVLFYMFYTNVGDVLQLAAAAELYSRDWRFHKEDRVWITRAPGMAPSEQTSTYERGTYYFFDVNNWRKVPKEFHLDYDKLEDRPSLPTNLLQQSTPSSASPGPQSVSSSTGGIQ